MTTRRMILIVLLPATGLLLYDLAGMYFSRLEQRQTPRNPVTGIAVGAEEQTLGPEDASGAVLFVHGFVGGSNNFAGVPEAVAREGWRVRVMRLPGHGTSPREFARTTPDELIEAVRGEAAALRARHARLVLAGHSMGGALCTLTAAEMPLEGLVLAAPYFGVTRHWYYGMRPETWTRLLTPLVPYVYKGNLFLQVNKRENKPQIYSYAWIPSQGMKTLIEIGERANQPEVLRQVDSPVLHLHAPGDRAASFHDAARAIEHMSAPSKRSVPLPNSNHHIFWDYDAQQVQDEILAFLRER